MHWKVFMIGCCQYSVTETGLHLRSWIQTRVPDQPEAKGLEQDPEVYAQHRKSEKIPTTVPFNACLT